MRKARASAKALLLILPVLVFGRISALSQTASPDSLKGDSLKADSLHRIKPDSLARPLVSIPFLGSVDRSIGEERLIGDSARHFTPYETLPDLLRLYSGYLTFDLGSPGTFQDLTHQGLGSRDVAIMNNGILLNEPYTGTVDLNPYPLEEAGRIEVIPETRSFLYGLNGTAGAINIVDANRRAVHPYSHIRYSEDGYDYSLVDGMISEDIMRGFNVTAGAQHTSAGGRFPNSDYDAWSGRVKVRYDLPGGVSVFGSESYSQTRLDLNGGIDSTTLPDFRFDRIQAAVRNTDSYEKRTRNDVRLGVAVNTPADSTAIHRITFFYSNNLREYRDEENRQGANGILFRQDQESRWYGALALEHRKLGSSIIDLGGEIQSIRSGAGSPPFYVGGVPRTTRYDVFAKYSFSPREGLSTALYGRFDHFQDQEHFSFGGDAVLGLDERFGVLGGASQSYRFPTLQEAAGTSPLLAPLADAAAERHRLIEAGIRSSIGSACLFEVKAFHRTIDDPIVVVAQPSQGGSPPYAFSRAASLTLRGFDGMLKLRLGSFLIEGTAQYVGSPGVDGSDGEFPAWSGSGGVYFWDFLAGGHLNLKLGVRGGFFSSFRGRSFTDQDQVDLPPALPMTIDAAGTADFVLIARLGNAYVHFVWENLSDRKYVMRIFYPMPDRSIHFGISWDFLD